MHTYTERKRQNASPLNAGAIMKAIIAKHCALLATATLATGLTVNHASAASAYEEPINVVVRYSDLNLSRPQDAATLYGRIRRAAHEACEDFDTESLERLQQFHRCMEQAVSNAVAKISSRQLTEIHEAQTHHQSRS
jgi:UrcA family protein